MIGDELGRILVGTQGLRKLQTRKMTGLKRQAVDVDDNTSKQPLRVSGKSVLASGMKASYSSKYGITQTDKQMYHPRLLNLALNSQR